jgi:hypothetical protein
MTDQSNGPELEPHEQAWLDATRSGEARTITHRVGECEVVFTVCRKFALAPKTVHVPHVSIQGTGAVESLPIGTITFSEAADGPAETLAEVLSKGNPTPASVITLTPDAAQSWASRWEVLSQARSGRATETHISMPAKHEQVLELETPLLGPEDLERIKDARVTAIPPSLGPQTFG